MREIPAYPLSGEGEHLFLFLEKKGVSTPQLAEHLAKALQLRPSEVSYAGLKDKTAVAQQLFCVPAKAEIQIAGLEVPAAKILWWKRHRNKLRTGHLRGNQFRIRIREVENVGAAKDLFERLLATGVPNYFGPQRFGAQDGNAERGKKLLQGSGGAGRFERKLYLSAYQSMLFNRALSARIERGAFGIALKGDVMRRCDSGGLFLCREPEQEQSRMDRFEVSPAGPIFGPRMFRPEEEVAAQEEKLLRDEGLTVDDFRAGKGEAEGSRRAYRVCLAGAGIEEHGSDLWVSFELPKGSYATVVLREMMGCWPA